MSPVFPGEKMGWSGELKLPTDMPNHCNGILKAVPPRPCFLEKITGNFLGAADQLPPGEGLLGGGVR